MAKKEKEKNPWIVGIKYSTLEEKIKYYGKKAKEQFEKFNDVEISVVRKDFKHGQISYGWGGWEKIVLFKDTNPPASKEDIEWMEKVAETIAEALNAKEL